jgi:hypothetical protein
MNHFRTYHEIAQLGQFSRGFVTSEPDPARRFISRSGPLCFSRIESGAMSIDHSQTAASVTIGALGYRARCTEAGCRNLARLGLRYADAGGLPIDHPVVCLAHGRERIARDKGGGSRSGAF